MILTLDANVTSINIKKRSSRRAGEFVTMGRSETPPTTTKMSQKKGLENVFMFALPIIRWGGRARSI
jgi:hypothetical protein